MRVTILQPSYIPWAGYFFQILDCDIFVFLDDVQYTKGNWRNRNKIKTPNGPLWITVPVSTKNRLGQTILEAEIDNRVNWRKKHWESIKQSYRKARCFAEYENFLRDVYSKSWEYLAELNIYLMVEISRLIGIETRFVRSSELYADGSKTERLVNICKKVGASEYMAGEGAKIYLKEDLFEKEHVKITYRDYHPVKYPQLYGEFIPYLSIVDMLFNCGKDSIKYLHLCDD